MSRSQRHQAEISGYCSRDSTFAQGAWSGATSDAVLLSLDPDSAIVGDVDVDVHLYGTGFSRESLVIANVVQRTNFVSDTELIVVVQPSQVPAATTVPITVQTGWYISNPLDFSFVEPAPLTEEEMHRVAFSET